MKQQQHYTIRGLTPFIADLVERAESRKRDLTNAKRETCGLLGPTRTLLASARAAYRKMQPSERRGLSFRQWYAYAEGKAAE